MAHGGFERLAENHDFLMHCVPGRRLAVLLHRFLVAVNAVLLDLTGRDFGESHVPEERDRMKPEPGAVALDVLRVSLTLGDDLVFALELRGGVTEGFLAADFAAAGLAAQPQILVRCVCRFRHPGKFETKDVTESPLLLAAWLCPPSADSAPSIVQTPILPSRLRMHVVLAVMFAQVLSGQPGAEGAATPGIASPAVGAPGPGRLFS